MLTPLRVLLVEDCDDDAVLLVAALRRAGYQVTHSRIETAADLRLSVQVGRWDVVLCDHNLPDFDSLTALRLVRSIDPDVPFIIVSGTIGEDAAVEALKQGADDYLLKQNLRRLAPAVKRGLHDAENRRRRREAERSNALIMAQSADVICTIGADMRLRTVSEAARTIWGWTPEELRGISLLDLVHPGDRSQTEEMVHRIMAGNQARNFENRHICKDGSAVHMMWSAYWSASDSLGFCIGRDVTERQQAAQALQTSEARLRSYIENAPLGIVLLDSEGNFSSANRSALELVGWDGATLENPAFRSIIPEPELPGALRDLDAFHREGHLEGEYRLLKSDGTPVWVLVRGVKTGDGKYILFGTDVTARKQAERQLKEREAQYRAVIETSPDGFGVIDCEGRILEVNDAYLRRSGYSREEILNMRVQDLSLRSGPDVFPGRLSRMGPEGSDLYESLHRTRDGVPWQVEISISRWPSVPDRLFVFVRDINRRMRSESMRRAQLALSELALDGTPEQLLRSALDAAEVRTESEAGFFYCASSDPNGEPILVWSSRTSAEYRAAAETARPWEPVLRSRGSIATGQTAGSAARPDLCVPVLRADRVAAVIGVCRRHRAYDPEDIETLYELGSAAIDLVERKWAEAALRESQERLSMALDATQMGVWEWDLTTGVVFWSPECYRISEATDFDHTFEGFSRIVVEEDRPLVNDQTRLASADGRPFVMEFRIRRPSGEVRWLSVLGQVRCDSGGQPRRFVGTVLDVTARRHAEDALRNSEERFRSLVETAFDWIWETGPEGDLTYSSDKIQDLLGYTPQEVLGRSLFSLLPADEAARLRDAFDQLQTRTLVRETIEHSGRHRDGRPVVLETSAQPVYGPAGELLGFRGMARDITERKHAQEQLRRFVSCSPAAIYALTLRRTPFEVTWASGNIEQLTGYPVEEVLKPEWFYKSVHPEDQPRIATAQAALLSNGRQVLEFRIRHQDGSYRWIRDEQHVLRDSQGAPVEAVGSWSDITDRMLLEEQLRHIVKMESVGRLAGGVAHDFNNLLTVMNGYADMLLASSKPWDPYRQRLEEIRRAGGRAAALTSQLLAFSRKQVLKPQPLILDRVIRDLESMLRRLVGEDIELNVRLDAAAGVVNADPHQLEQVIMNLVVNARDAMPQGGRLTIETHCSEPPAGSASSGSENLGWVAMTVSDTGMGMSSAIRSRIFEPFFTTKEAGKGTGLGLSVVLGIVEQSGGQIEIETEPQMGARFRILLPRTADAVAATETRPSGDVFGNETILVVEDQPEVLEFTAQALASYGYNVLRAGSAADALRIFEAECRNIGLVLTDVVMPQVSGWDLAARLREIQPEAKVVYMSGYADHDGVREHISESGATLIQKPFVAHDLAAHIRQALGSAAPSGHILVVDDEESIRLFLRMALEQAGYRVSEAADGRLALIEARKQPVDLLLTDIVMPEQEGLETIGRFRQELPGVRIIAMSGHFDAGYLRMAEALGADSALKKPIEIDALLARVGEVLAARR
ncbi:MAG: PAS domain S-box protein [Bryobacterales bacterium]|nr:PAS domain S-box protein [Bryobacterales bacterium]